MKKLGQEEFERCIERLISGEISKGRLAKELKTDPRTLDIKIQEMSAKNPELYERYLKALPYKQKGYDHIDFEALLIYILKQGLTIDEAVEQFGTSRRTINRRINSMENKELAQLYKEVADNRKHSRKDSLDIIERIEELEERPIVLRGINDRRREELLKIESEFNELCKTMTKDEAANKMGLGSRDRVYKLLNELYRIEIETEQKENSQSVQSGSFREDIKVDIVPKAGNDKKDSDIEPISKKQINETGIEGR